MLLCGRGICTGTFAICRALDGRASADVSVAIVASLVGAGCLLGGIVLGIVRRVPLALGLQTAGVVLLGVAGVVLLVGGNSVISSQQARNTLTSRAATSPAIASTNPPVNAAIAPPAAVAGMLSRA